MRPKLSSLVILLSACIADAGPLQLRWTAELSDPKPYNAVLFAGESADLQATLKLYGRPVALETNATAALYWQTNGMGSAWWQSAATATTGGVVTATWTPAMDAGADLYRWHLGVANAASSTIYRAFGAFRMQPSPGAVPNEIPIPPRVIDFSAVTVLNPPWATPADLAPATNALALATSALQPPATNGLLRAEADTLATVTARGATTTAAVTIGNRGAGDVGGMSLAQGEGVIASGDSSHAEGHSTTASGQASHAEGVSTTASGAFSHAEGVLTTASGYCSHASGLKAYIPDTDDCAFAWQGTDGSFSESQYNSHGPGTYNLNPAGGLAGFWIGEETMGSLLDAKSSYLDATNIAAAATSSLVTRADSTNLVHDISTSLIGHPFVLQGSTVVPATNAVLTLSGVATMGASVINLMPWRATRPTEASSTGTLHIATAPDTYIVDVSGDIRVTQPEYGTIPKDNFPVEWSSSRVDDTNWIISAWAPGHVSTYEPKSGQGYYATLSNLVVYTYNRPGYRPNTLTNDTAALPTYLDTVDLRRAPRRLAVPAGSVVDYVDSRKREIAASAWRITPAGRDAPSTQTVTLDLPLVQQGQIAYLQSGDYYVLSYEGGDWRSTSEGSRWQIGASGRADFSITSEGRMGHVRDFEVAGNVAHIYASTNWMHGAGSPYIEMTESLDDPQWLTCQDCAANYHVDAANGDYWLFTAPATANQMFYRVVIPGGERRIISTPTHRFEGGVEFNGTIYNIITITNGTERIEVLGRRL